MTTTGIEGLGKTPDLGKAAAKKPATEGELAKVASQFEALLIGQIMQSMKIGFGDNGAEDPTGNTMLEFAQEHLAKSIADGGGLGLATLIKGGLRQKSEI